MSQVLGVIDGGATQIKDKSGQPVNVGVIVIRTSENESAPVDHVGYCRLNYKDSIIKSLKRIKWHRPKPDPKEPVIPAQAGIHESEQPHD
jgi:hypothetical protein